MTTPHDPAEIQAAIDELLAPLTHHTDADCTLDPADDTCRICGVWHGDPCPECDGRGYHSEECPELLGPERLEMIAALRGGRR